MARSFYLWLISKSSFFILIVFSAFYLNRALNADVSREFKKVSRDSDTVVTFKWNAELYQILSFGHIPASVDWLLIKFLTDSNISKITDGKETEASRILNLATDIDQAFFQLYTAGTNFLAIARNDIYGARKLIEKGAAFIENDLPHYDDAFIKKEEWVNGWKIRMIQGYLYLIEFQDAEKAALAYGAMDAFPTLPAGLKGLSASIKTTEGQFRISLNSIVVIKGWYQDDPVMTEELNRKELLLKLGQSLYKWNRDFADYKPKKNETVSERFNRYKVEYGLPNIDSFGGKILLNDNNRIDSTTPREKTFGISF